MLREFVSESGKDWPQWVPFLFAIREVPQASTGFSPFELYGQQPRGILDIFKEEWEMTPQTEKAPASHLEALRRKLQILAQLAQEELAKTQGDQKRWYDAQVRLRTFDGGQKVLLLLPSTSNKLLIQWQGPYEVLERVGEVNYHIQVPGQGIKLYHDNILKEWQEGRSLALQCRDQLG